ncbi:MAG: double zinc ribbon domain-containing protein [Bdellovibrionales bacterium]
MQKYAAPLVDAVLPPLCVNCRADVLQQGALCAACWKQLNFIGDAQCTCCGVPFDILDGAANLQCDACLSYPPTFSRARAPLVYDDASRSMVMRLKHGDDLYIVSSFVPFLRQAGAEILARADALVPVPLARWRLWRRRYNQAALLSGALGNATGIATWPDALLRTRATPSQGGLDRKQRQKNVKDAFVLNTNYADAVRHKNIILIDDVVTTGATVNECAKVLLDANAARVDVLALARVPLGR